MHRIAALILILFLAPLTGCAAKAYAAAPEFQAFFTQTFPLAKSDFRSVQGSLVRFAKTSFTADLPEDPKVFNSCEIERFASSFLNCVLTQYTGARWFDAVREISAALPPDFKMYYATARTGSRQLMWIRSSDAINVHLVENITTQPLHIWVEQSIKIPAHPELVDASKAPIPIFQDARASQVLRLGLLLASDSMHSYVLTVASQRGGEPVFLGNPLAPGGWWRLVSGRILAYDQATGLTLLVSPILAVRPQPLEVNLAQGTPISLLRYSFCAYQQMLDAVSCSLDKDTGIISAVNPRSGEFEHSTLNQVYDADGAPIVDARENVIAGVTLGPDLRGGAGASIGVSAGEITRFVQAASPTVAALQPKALAAGTGSDVALIDRVKQSTIRIEVLDLSTGRAHQRAGTGVVVEREGNGALVVSAAHVLPTPAPSEGYRATVTAGNSSPLPAVVRKVDWKHDLALFFVAKLHSPPIVVARTTVPGSRVGILGFGYSSLNLTGGDGSELVQGTIGAVNVATGYVSYDLATEQGLSGGPVFDLKSGHLVGLVHGEVGNEIGGYEGIAAEKIGAFLASSKAQSPLQPHTVLESPDVRRVAKSLALIDCALSDSKHLQATGVIVASDSNHSYIATAQLQTCHFEVYIGGDRSKAFDGREVARDEVTELQANAGNMISQGVELVAINRGNLPVIELASRSPSEQKAYVLSYAGSALAQFENAQIIPPRVDETQYSDGSGYFESNNGIGMGGAIVDSTYGHLLGITTFNGEMKSLGSFDAHGYLLPPPPSDVRVRYSFASANAVDHRLQFSVDDVPYKRTDPLPNGFRGNDVIAVMQEGRISGYPDNDVGFASAVPIGVKDGRSFFISVLYPSDLQKLSLAFTDANGATSKVTAEVAASESSSRLALLSTSELAVAVPQWVRTQTSVAKTFVPYFSFCSWEPQTADLLHVKGYELPACRYRSYSTTLATAGSEGRVAIGSPGIRLGMTCQGGPLVDFKTFSTEGLAADCNSGYDTSRVAAFLASHGWQLNTLR